MTTEKESNYDRLRRLVADKKALIDEGNSLVARIKEIETAIQELDEQISPLLALDPTPQPIAEPANEASHGDSQQV